MSCGSGSSDGFRHLSCEAWCTGKAGGFHLQGAHSGRGEYGSTIQGSLPYEPFCCSLPVHPSHGALDLAAAQFSAPLEKPDQPVFNGGISGRRGLLEGVHTVSLLAEARRQHQCKTLYQRCPGLFSQPAGEFLLMWVHHRLRVQEVDNFLCFGYGRCVD